MTAQPSPEFRRHHDVAPPRVDRRAFRQGWQVHTRLMQLRDDGAIDEAAYQAAIRFRADWDAAFGRGRSAPLLALPGSGSMTEHDRMFRRLAVLDRLTAAAAHVGPFFAKLLQQCVVEDRTWAWIARTHGVSDKTARKWTIAALGRLATLETAAREPPGARYTARPEPDVFRVAARSRRRLAAGKPA
jgi:hypothetical protein